jgi:Fe-S-cluster containining protein
MTGVPLNDLLKQLTEAMQESCSRLPQNRTPDMVYTLAEGAARIHDGAVTSFMPSLPPTKEIACAAGCSHCCHLPVVTEAITVLRLAHYIRTTFTPEAVEALRARIGARQTQLLLLDRPARRHFRQACPLLTDGQCSAYEARPLICRSFNSFDAVACRREILDKADDFYMEGYPIPFEVGAALTRGMVNGLSHAGYRDAQLDLAAALGVALERADAAEAWLAGEDIFADSLVA